MSEVQKEVPKSQQEGTDKSLRSGEENRAKLHGDSEVTGLGKSRNEQSCSASATLEQKGQLGKLKVCDSSNNKSESVLNDPKSSSEAKLQAAASMAASGQKTFTDVDGRKFEINTHDYGKHSAVVVGAADKHGRFQPALRGLIDKNGNVSQQVDGSGHKVDYVGERARVSLADSPVLQHSADGAKAPSKQPEAKPADGKPADSKPADGKPADGKPADGKPADGKPADGKPADGKPADGKAPGANDANIKKDADLAASEKKQWTIAVELGTTGPGSETNPMGAGVEPKLAYLKQLAKETENKSVNFVVAAERPVDRKGELCHADGKSAKDIAACDVNASQKDLAKTERYFIHDGKIDKLPDQKSTTPANELSDLLKTATQLAPSEKIGLLIQSQQQGNSDGLVMNKAPLTMPQAIESIKAGLKGSEHSKLDVLDFDACSISNVGMLNASKEVANNVVASSAIEKVTPSADGQNLQAAFRSLLNNPAQSGREFASEIVSQARSGANGQGDQNGTPTLAAFDMQKYDGFKQDFDKFGSELNRAFHDKSLQGDIRKAVDASPVAPDGRNEEQSHVRDVKAFAQNLLDNLHGKDPALEKSAADLLKSFDSMAVSQYGDKSQGQVGIGGLGISLPGKEIVDKHEVGKIYSPLHQMEQTLKDSSGIKFDEKASFAKDLKQTIESIGMPKSAETRALNESARKIASAATPDALNAAMKEMNSLLHEQESSAFGKRLASESEQGFSMAWRTHQKDHVEKLGQGWDQFYKQLDRPID